MIHNFDLPNAMMNSERNFPVSFPGQIGDSKPPFRRQAGSVPVTGVDIESLVLLTRPLALFLFP